MTQHCLFELARCATVAKNGRFVHQWDERCTSVFSICEAFTHDYTATFITVDEGSTKTID